MADLLERLALVESPSLVPDSQGPALGLLVEELERVGLDVTRVPGRGVGDHLHARPREGGDAGPYQLILGHVDTVWPLGTLKTMPVRRDGGRLRGPGVYDMKGGLVQGVFALGALAEQGLSPPLRPQVFVNSDEEIGSPESSAHIARLAHGAARAFVLEPSFGPTGRLKTARKGVGRFRIRIRGQASHAGIAPGAGVSAILEVSHQIQRLFALNDAERGTSVNVGTVDGGLRPNVVAPEATALVDARVRTTGDAREVERAIRGLTPVGEGLTIEVEGGFGRPPMEPTPRNRALWRAARAAADALAIPLDEAAVGGGSDGNTTSLYTATLDGLGPVGDGAHALHEHVEVARMPERAALLALLLMAPVGPDDDTFRPREEAPRA